MKVSHITRVETAARFPQKAASASDLASPARIVHHITPSGTGGHTITTTITTTVTSLPAAGSAPRYQPTIERFTLRSPPADPPASAEEAAVIAQRLEAAGESMPTAGPVLDHLVQYFHAMETARLARFLASVKTSRNARADRAVQLAQAYANHE